MRLLTCVLAVLVLAGTAAAAAPVHTDKGDKAMVFSFDGLCDLDIDGMSDEFGVGMRYYFGDMSAIRAGIIFGKCGYTVKGLEEGQEDLETTGTSLGFEANYERHLEAPCASVSPYIGGGVAYESFKSEDQNFDVSQPTFIIEDSWFDVYGLAGFEWGFTECITLGGEARLGFESGNYKEKGDNETSTVTLYDEDYSCLGFYTVALFLSVYW